MASWKRERASKLEIERKRENREKIFDGGKKNCIEGGVKFIKMKRERVHKLEGRTKKREYCREIEREREEGKYNSVKKRSEGSREGSRETSLASIMPRKGS